MKISNKQVITITAALVTGLAIFGFAVFRSQNSDSEDFGNDDMIGKTYLRSGYGDGNFLYSCSKEIEVVYQGSSLGPGAVYTPVNQEEADKYCRSNAAIEYRAVIDILKRDDVSSVIAKYDTTQASVKALGHKYIHDKDYLKRILPAYSDVKIDCIIVVHSPEGTRFFIEDAEKHESHHDHRYREVPAEEFLASLNKAPDVDVNNFWLALH